MEQKFLEFTDCRSTGVGGQTTYRLVLNGGVVVRESTEEFDTSGSGNHWSERVEAPKDADECIIRFNRNRNGRDFEATVVSEPVPDWATPEFLRVCAERFAQGTLESRTRNRYQ